MGVVPRLRLATGWIAAVFLVGLVLFGECVSAADRGGPSPEAVTRLLKMASEKSVIPVIVALKVDHVAEPYLNEVDASRQREAIANAQNEIIQLLGRDSGDVTRYRHIPYVALNASETDIAVLAASGTVRGISEDMVFTPMLYESVPLIGADDAWNGVGVDGSGYAVAIIDTGVDNDHPFLANKIVHEYCSSTTVIQNQNVVYQGICPGQDSELCEGPDCADDLCSSGYGYCHHGTHVAGIAAGERLSQSPFMAGIGKGANIIAMQVASLHSSGNLGLIANDFLAALQEVYDLRYEYNIASINISFGTTNLYAQICDSGNYPDPYDEPNVTLEAIKDAVDDLRAAGIATIAATGNLGNPQGISAPACISSVISVGNSTKGVYQGGAWVGRDEVFIDSCNYGHNGSNLATFVDLLAPGSAAQDDLCSNTGIYSSVPFAYDSSYYVNLTGTSMATPHVTGSWAVLKEAYPNESVEYMLSRLIETGVMVTDSRYPYIEKPRIQLDAALEYDDVWVDFGYSGDEFGTRGQPHNTLVEGVLQAQIGGQVNIEALHQTTLSAESPFTITKNLSIVAVGAAVIVQ